MNTTHIHLFLNHLPIIGSILGGLVLAHALWTKSEMTKIAAYNLLIISSVGAVITYLTGEEAEESIENIQGISKQLIEQHEEFALFALIALIILGVASLLGLIITIRKSSWSKTIATITLFISLISFGLIAKTGYMGGQIRHTELNGNTTMQDQGGTTENDED